MLRRILETFFLAQVISEKIAENVIQAKDKYFPAAKRKSVSAKKRAGVASMHAPDEVLDCHTAWERRHLAGICRLEACAPGRVLTLW
jgi:hypothetical protein